MDKQEKIILKQIKKSNPEFIDYLQLLSAKNYKSFKVSDSKHNDIHKGYALAIDELIESFLSCDKETNTANNSDWAQ